MPIIERPQLPDSEMERINRKGKRGDQTNGPAELELPQGGLPEHDPEAEKRYREEKKRRENPSAARGVTEIKLI